jgi:hypothetical protein
MPGRMGAKHTPHTRAASCHGSWSPADPAPSNDQGAEEFWIDAGRPDANLESAPQPATREITTTRAAKILRMKGTAFGCQPERCLRRTTRGFQDWEMRYVRNDETRLDASRRARMRHTDFQPMPLGLA